jgi:hypothetical protein
VRLAKLSLKLSRTLALCLTYPAMSFHNGDVTLSGTLLLPATKGPHPAIVLGHGSEAQDRNGHVGNIRFMADHLARHGIAALIYDKRGSGRSSGDPLPAWRGFKGPVLGIFGELDAQTPVAAVVPRFTEALMAREGADFTVSVFPNASQLMMQATRPSDDELERLTQMARATTTSSPRGCTGGCSGRSGRKPRLELRDHATPGLSSRRLPLVAKERREGSYSRLEGSAKRLLGRRSETSCGDSGDPVLIEARRHALPVVPNRCDDSGQLLSLPCGKLAQVKGTH